MPYVHLTIAGPAPTDAARRRLAAGLTRLMAEVLGKDPALTAVRVETAETGLWTVGGTPVSPAAHLEATVTAGTNSAADKARFIAQAMELLKGEAGPGLPLATYGVVREIAADSWGYDGRTQAARR